MDNSEAGSPMGSKYVFKILAPDNMERIFLKKRQKSLGRADKSCGITYFRLRTLLDKGQKTCRCTWLHRRVELQRDHCRTWREEGKVERKKTELY